MKMCDAEDYERFAPARPDIVEKIEKMRTRLDDYRMQCFDLAEFNSLNIFGSFESDSSSRIELKLVPKLEAMQIYSETEIWDKMGLPEI